MSVEDTDRFSVFDHRPFTYFWFSRITGQMSMQMQAVAVGWQVYELTNNPLDLGLVGLSQFFATVAFALVAGQVADRYDRRKVVRMSQIVIAMAMTALMVGSFSGWLTREAIFAIVFVIGAARSFEAPTQQTLLPALVPPTVLSRAVAATSSSMQIATIIGPAVGGLLYVLGPSVVYSVCAALYLTSALLTTLMHTDRVPPRREPMTIAVVFAGVTFIWNNPVILGAATLDMFAVLLGGATALLPVYAKDILHTGPWGLGMLRLAPAVGALCMAILLSRTPLRHHAGRIMFAGVGTFGLATVVFGLSTWFPLSVAALVVLGGADLLSVVVRQTLIQLRTPDEMRGRVSAVNSLFVGTSNQLGEFESGLTAAAFGTVASVVAGGIGTVVVVLAAIKLFPELVRVDTMEKPVPTTLQDVPKPDKS